MNVNDFIKHLDLHGAGRNQNIIIEETIYNSWQPTEKVTHSGYEFEIKPKISVIREISKLPEYVYFEGGTFQILIFPNGKDECRFCYQCLGFEEGSKHKEQWDKYHCWDNQLLGGGTYDDENGVEQISEYHTCSFLYLRECIETDEELVGVLKDALEFLTVNKLI